MNQELQEKLQAYLQESRITVASLEHKAGLKGSVIRNILRGKSKHPTQNTLEAITAVTGLDLSAFIKRAVPIADFSVAFTQIGQKIEDHELFKDIVQEISTIVVQENVAVTLQQFFHMTSEVYRYTMKKKKPQLDRDFTAWFVRKTLF